MKEPGEYITESSEHYYTGLLGQKTREELRRRYSNPKRHYHTWEHPREMFRMLERVDEQVECLPGVVLAIVYHDVVYDPRRTDNEARSAALMRRMCRGMDQFWIERADTLITATKGHVLPPGDAAADAAHFLDMDLGILGAPEQRYRRYCADVGAEYSHLTPEQWRQGRAQVLRAFLRRLGEGQLFHTDWARAAFTERASENMHTELRELVGDGHL